MNVRIPLILLALLVMCGSCSATFIRMVVDMSTPLLVTEDSFDVNVTVTNTGDEPAHDVQLGVEMPDGFVSQDAYIGTLYQNRPVKSQIRVDVGDVNPGRYPLVLKTHYADANAYPFSTISAKFVDYKEHAKASARAILEGANISGEETREVKVTIINSESKQQSYQVRLHTPNEIAVENPLQSIQIPALGERDVVFNVKSFGALPDSSYWVVAAITYEDESRGSKLQNSVITGGTVGILKAGTSRYVPGWAPIAVVVLLILAFIYFQFKGRGRAEETDEEEEPKRASGKPKKKKRGEFEIH